MGTSAGAVTAVLLAAGYKGTDLLAILDSKSFNDFLTRPRVKVVLNIFRYRALHSGQALQDWLERLIRDATHTEFAEMKDLIKHRGRAVLYACIPNNASETFDSTGRHDDTKAAFAARASSAIPVFFNSPTLSDQPIFDGGMRNNFPLRRFLQSESLEPDFIGLRLIAEKPVRLGWLASFFAAAFEQDEAEICRRYSTRIINIDPTPIRTTDFDITQAGKDLLKASGRAAALQFLGTRGKGTAQQRDLATAQLGQARARVIAERRTTTRSWQRRMSLVAVVAALVVAHSQCRAFWLLRWLQEGKGIFLSTDATTATDATIATGACFPAGSTVVLAFDEERCEWFTGLPSQARAFLIPTTTADMGGECVQPKDGYVIVCRTKCLVRQDGRLKLWNTAGRLLWPPVSITF